MFHLPRFCEVPELFGRVGPAGRRNITTRSRRGSARPFGPGSIPLASVTNRDGDDATAAERARLPVSSGTFNGPGDPDRPGASSRSSDPRPMRRGQDWRNPHAAGRFDDASAACWRTGSCWVCSRSFRSCRMARFGSLWAAARAGAAKKIESEDYDVRDPLRSSNPPRLTGLVPRRVALPRKLSESPSHSI